MPFDLRVKYHTRIQVFHILNGNAPEYLNGIFQFALNSHYSLRSGYNSSLRQLKPNTEFYRTCLCIMDVSFGIVCQLLLEIQLAQVFFLKLQLFLFPEQIV